MNNATTHNEPSSAPTSRSERPHEIKLSEADYLAREVADAKAALAHSLADLKAGLASTADLRQWVKHYPWAALGAATVAGFAAAAAVTPAPGESITDKLSRMRPDRHSSSANESASAPQRPPESPKTAGVADKLISSLFDIAKILVQTLIVTTLQRPAEAASEQQIRADALATRVAT